MEPDTTPTSVFPRPTVLGSRRVRKMLDSRPYAATRGTDRPRKQPNIWARVEIARMDVLFRSYVVGTKSNASFLIT